MATAAAAAAKDKVYATPHPYLTCPCLDADRIFLLVTHNSLVIGSNTPTGSLRTLLSKITNINSKHGPFTCILSLGDLFNANEEDVDTKDVLDGKLAFPVPTYCMLGERELPLAVRSRVERDGGEICENLSYLGGSRTVRLSSQGGSGNDEVKASGNGGSQ